MLATDVGVKQRLYAVSEVDGGLTSFTLTPFIAASLGAELPVSSSGGIYGVSDIEVARLGSSVVIAPAGRYDDAFGLISLDADGDPINSLSVAQSGLSAAGMSEIEIVQSGSISYLVAGRGNAGGITVFSLGTAPSISVISQVLDDDYLSIGNVSDLVAFNNGHADLVIAASSVDHGVTSMKLDSIGRLSVADVIDGMKGCGIYQASEISVAEVIGKDLLVVGAVGSSNLATFEIADDGALTLRDIVWDSLTTLFSVRRH